jgi:hypothetical protein
LLLQEEAFLSWRRHPVDDIVLALDGFLTGSSFLNRDRWSPKAWLRFGEKVFSRRANLTPGSAGGGPELQDGRLPSTLKVLKMPCSR